MSDKHDFTMEKRDLAKWRVVQAAKEYRACCALSPRDAEKEKDVQAAQAELFKRLGELEALGG